MTTFAEYINVGRLQQITEKGWFRITIKGKVIIITFVGSDPLAIEIYDFNNPDVASLPADFHPESAEDFEPLLDPPMESWGYLKTYPVKIEGNDIFIGFNPLD